MFFHSKKTIYPIYYNSITYKKITFLIKNKLVFMWIIENVAVPLQVWLRDDRYHKSSKHCFIHTKIKSYEEW